SGCNRNNSNRGRGSDACRPIGRAWTDVCRRGAVDGTRASETPGVAGWFGDNGRGQANSPGASDLRDGIRSQSAVNARQFLAASGHSRSIGESVGVTDARNTAFVGGGGSGAGRTLKEAARSGRTRAGVAGTRTADRRTAPHHERRVPVDATGSVDKNGR